MAITKKTMEQIAKENNIDISEENAQKVADAYIQPTLNALKTAEQQAVADTQTQLKSLENDYFNAYRAGLYNTQSRGLSGGLEMLQESQLRSQLASENSKINNALLQKQAELETNRGTALSNASAYKTDYLNKLLSQVQSLREADYAQRYQAWLDAQQLDLQRQQLAQSAYNNRIQEQAYADEYAKENLQDIYQTHRSMVLAGEYNEAEKYLKNQMAKLENLGYDTSAVERQFMNINTYSRALENATLYGERANDAWWSRLWSNLLAMPNSGQATRNYDIYSALAQNAEKIIQDKDRYIPSWYTKYNNVSQ